VEAGRSDKLEDAGMKGFAHVMSKSSRYRTVLRVGKLAQKLVVRQGEIRIKAGPLKGWNTYRVTPSLPKQSFHERWPTLEQELRKELQTMEPNIERRLKQRLDIREEGERST